MIRSPLGLRLHSSRPIREQIREAARSGAKGVVLDAIGDLAPDRLSETGRRELRHLLRTVELAPIALSLPTRRPFDTPDQLEDRLKRADGAFTLAYELGTKLVLARVGAVPPDSETFRRETWLSALNELGRRADHRGVRIALETGTEPGSVLRGVLDALNNIGLAASIDPASHLLHGGDPVGSTQELGSWVAHAGAGEAAATSPLVLTAHPRGQGFPPGGLDWEGYLGALEEINYRGFLTIATDPTRDPGAQFQAISQRLARL